MPSPAHTTRSRPGGIELELDAARAPDLTLFLQARAEDVAVVRQALTGLAEHVALDPDVLADVKTAVSEACNNAVVHAYSGQPGPLQVEVRRLDGQLQVVVSDEGRGVSAPRDPDAPGQGVGLALIYALSDDAEVAERQPAGTAVRMCFALAGGGPGDAPPGTIPQPLVAAVLGRVVAMLAARASFSLDRLSDAQLVSDAVAAHAPEYLVDGLLRVGAQDAEGSLTLRVGPLRQRSAPQLVRDSELPGVGPLLEQLVDGQEISAEPGAPPGDGEYLELRLDERPLPAR